VNGWWLLYLAPGLLGSRPVAQRTRLRFTCPRCSPGVKNPGFCTKHLTEGGALSQGWPQAVILGMLTLVGWPLTLYGLWLLAPEVRPSRIKQLRRRAALDKLRAENDELERQLNKRQLG
jgi:hypothetical protein